MSASLIKQKTIKEEILISGVSLHRGKYTKLKIIPAKENTGIKFIRTDKKKNNIVKAHSAEPLKMQVFFWKILFITRLAFPAISNKNKVVQCETIAIVALLSSTVYMVLAECLSDEES